MGWVAPDGQSAAAALERTQDDGDADASETARWADVSTVMRPELLDLGTVAPAPLNAPGGERR